VICKSCDIVVWREAIDRIYSGVLGTALTGIRARCKDVVDTIILVSKENVPT